MHVFLTKLSLYIYDIYSIGDQNVIHIHFRLIHVCIVQDFFLVEIYHVIKQNDEERFSSAGFIFTAFFHSNWVLGK